MEKEDKRKWMQYLQQLQDKVLAEDIALLWSIEDFQAVGSKYKEVTSEDEERQQSSKKTEEKQPGKYHRNTAVKMGDVNTCEKYVCAEQDCLVHNLRWVKKFLFVFSLLIVTLS